MFVRTKTTPNSPRKSIQIVKNDRDKKTGKVKQKILRHVGIAMDDDEEKKLKKLGEDIIKKMIIEEYNNSPQINMFSAPSMEEINLNKKKIGRKQKKRLEDVLPVNQVTLDDIIEENRIIDGVHEVAGYLYDTLKYNSILTKNKKYNNILKDLVLCRISNPKSKLATSNYLKRYYMKEHDINSIYRTMDHVFKNISKIKSIVFQSTRNLMPDDVEIILFDVTTLHFESTEVDELRKFGWSKNFRFNTTQVVLALATNGDGLPIGYELFEGNKAEVTTLIDTIDTWKESFNIVDVTFIGDRAMFSANNLYELDKRNYKYIVAAKLRSLPEVMQNKILNNNENYKANIVDNVFSWIGNFQYEESDLDILRENKAKKKQIKDYKLLIEQNKNRFFVVNYSSKRAHNDIKKRDKILEKIEKQLNKTSDSTKLVTNSGIKKYTTSSGKSKSYIDQNKVDADSQWDGIHGVITNIKSYKLSEIISKYKKLIKIEDCFRVNKTTLKMRPIFHFKPERIHAHIAICYMAFAVIRQLEYRAKLVKKISVTSIIEELNSVQSSIYRHKTTKDRYRVPGNFSNDARKIYSSIGLQRSLDAHPII